MPATRAFCASPSQPHARSSCFPVGSGSVQQTRVQRRKARCTGSGRCRRRRRAQGGGGGGERMLDEPRQARSRATPSPRRARRAARPRRLCGGGRAEVLRHLINDGFGALGIARASGRRQLRTARWRARGGRRQRRRRPLALRRRRKPAARPRTASSWARRSSGTRRDEFSRARVYSPLQTAYEWVSCFHAGNMDAVKRVLDRTSTGSSTTTSPSMAAPPPPSTPAVEGAADEHDRRLALHGRLQGRAPSRRSS